MHTLKRQLLLVIGSLVLLLPAAPVFAEGTSGADSSGSSLRTQAQEKEAKLEAERDAANAKKQADKLKRCEDKQTDINNRLKDIATRGQKQLDLFTAIAARTEKFYTDKSLSLNNYDDLVAAVNSKKASAQATVDKISNDSVTFKCDSGTDPKTQLANFKTDLKAEIAALKEYRTSVKNLIVGVKSALNLTKEGSNVGQ